MAETQEIIGALKRALRAAGLTYGDVARGLGMSEANVKRMFAAERMTLDRIEAICRLLEMDLSDLFQLYEESRQRITRLSESQEQQLVADTRLLLVAVCVRNHLSFQEILDNYHIVETDLIRCLAKLDRLKLIDLLPNNKIKLRVAENFSWIPDGPIEQYYEKSIQGEFLARGFGGDQNTRIFQFALLSEGSKNIIQHRLQALANEMVQLHRQDRDLPLNQRHSVGLLAAMREWEFSVLAPFSR